MILRDPVHGLIAFDSAEESIVPRLMATAEVQRLRRIRQLGVTNLAFPGAEHSRFTHAIGTAHVMKRLIRRLRDVENALPQHHRIDEGRAREALAAALLHDVGHGPLSHLFEDAIAGAPTHESWTTDVVLDPSSEVHRVLAAEGRELPQRVAELVVGRHELPYLARAVSGTLDVDRCDYLLRDAHATGVRYGHYDLDWLLRSLRFAPSFEGDAPALAIEGSKGIVPLESFLLARHFMFQQVYFHKATRAAEWMIHSILARAAALLRNGTHLDAVPIALERSVRGARPELGAYLDLDDSVLLGTIHTWEAAADPVLADLSRRVRRRDLFKTLELDAHDPRAWEAAHHMARDLSRRHGLDPDAYVGLDVPSDIPYTEGGDPLSVVFSNGRARKPSEVSFLLGRLRGESVVRPRLVFAPELRDAIRRALAS